MSAVAPSPKAAILAAGVAAVAGWTAGRVSTVLERQTLHRQATHDALTGLANRAGLARGAARIGTTSGSGRLALLLVDLDAFKDVNDAYGHDAGDAVLVQAAQRLQVCARDLAAGAAVVARPGGDEFAVLLALPGPAAGAGAAADRAARVAHDALCRSYLVPTAAGRRVPVGASIGVAVTEPGQVPDLGWLLTAADGAMYAAKRRGGGWFVCAAGIGRATAHPFSAALPTRRVGRRVCGAAPLDGRRLTLASLNRRGRVAGPLSDRPALEGDAS